MKVCKHDRVLRCVDCENETLRSKVEEMQKTLEWYANGWNYVRGSHDQLEIIKDDGERARQALKGESQ